MKTWHKSDLDLLEAAISQPDSTEQASIQYHLYVNIKRAEVVIYQIPKGTGTTCVESADQRYKFSDSWHHIANWSNLSGFQITRLTGFKCERNARGRILNASKTITSSDASSRYCDQSSQTPKQLPNLTANNSPVQFHATERIAGFVLQLWIRCAKKSNHEFGPRIRINWSTLSLRVTRLSLCHGGRRRSFLVYKLINENSMYGPRDIRPANLWRTCSNQAVLSPPGQMWECYKVSAKSSRTWIKYVINVTTFLSELMVAKRSPIGDHEALVIPNCVGSSMICSFNSAPVGEQKMTRYSIWWSVTARIDPSFDQLIDAQSVVPMGNC